MDKRKCLPIIKIFIIVSAINYFMQSFSVWTQEKDNQELSKEDETIIENMEVLENLDLLEKDIDFLYDYQEIKNLEGDDEK